MKKNIGLCEKYSKCYYNIQFYSLKLVATKYKGRLAVILSYVMKITNNIKLQIISNIILFYL